MKFINFDDLEATARSILPQMAYDYYASGADDEITVRRNRAAFGEIGLHYRVLRDIGPRDLRITLFDQELSSPIIIAPTAFHRMAHPDGEIATARAAGASNTLMILSTLATTSLEEVAQAATGPLWFQLYMYKDREITADLVDRAEAAGYKALVVTVDAPIWGRRERDVRNNFQLPPGLSLRNLMEPRGQHFPEGEGSGLAAYVARMFKGDLGWSDIEWLCQRSRLPVLIKGVVHHDDAALAPQHGAAGVVVSNHGGRQLDTAPATIEVLPRIAEALDGRSTIILDGGVRRGTDVVKALAYGAHAVAVGRPILWGLTIDGEGGVTQVLSHLRHELDAALALVGVMRPGELDRGYLC